MFLIEHQAHMSAVLDSCQGQLAHWSNSIIELGLPSIVVFPERCVCRVALAKAMYRATQVLSPTNMESKPATGRYLAVLTLGSLGVVYGDIGTSPLYALRECFAGVNPLP